MTQTNLFGPEPEPPKDDEVTVSVKTKALAKIVRGLFAFIVLPSGATLGVNSLTSKPVQAEAAAEKSTKAAKEATAAAKSATVEVTRQLDSLRAADAANVQAIAALATTTAELKQRLERMDEADREFYRKEWSRLLERVGRLEGQARAWRRSRRDRER